MCACGEEQPRGFRLEWRRPAENGTQGVKWYTLRLISADARSPEDLTVFVTQSANQTTECLDGCSELIVDEIIRPATNYTLSIAAVSGQGRSLYGETATVKRPRRASWASPKALGPRSEA